MRYLIVELIKKMAKGETIRLRQLQSRVYSVFPNECDRLGFTASRPIEEKWRKEIRFGLQDAKHQGLIEHSSSAKSGLWKRI
jgi:hypothetical protein